jgi:GTP-binding nuclear protein Ran
MAKSNIISTPTFDVLLIGDRRVGKTTFINRHLTFQFIKEYTPSNNITVYRLNFNTNYGPICLKVIDYPEAIPFNYTVDFEAVIIMFDLTSKSSYNNIIPRLDRLRNTLPMGNIVICGNKIDILHREVLPRDIDVKPQKYYDVSAKSNYQFYKPFLYLLRQLTGNNNLEIIEELRQIII